MSGPSTARRPSRAARVLGHIAVVIGILAVLAAAFALSYDAVRDIALAAGVPVTLARIYPGIFDAVFLVACAAALMLRTARWWTRLYAWLSVLLTGALIGAADAYHAMGLRLPQRITAGTIAALPWALVMLGFSLWLSMLRHAKSGRVPEAPDAAAYPSVPAGQPLALEARPAARAALPAPAPAAAAPEPAPEPAEPTAAAEAHDDAERPSPARPPRAASTEDDDHLEDHEDEPQPAARPHPADQDTPPYGFPAVTGQASEDGTGAADSESVTDTAETDKAETAGTAEAETAEAPDSESSATAPAPRMPTLLSAPVPADVAARGKPPSAVIELPVAEAELSHEDRPAPAAPSKDAAEDAPAPAGKRPPVRFERVRSTPTPPAPPEDEES
jgi:hypothetical protein